MSSYFLFYSDWAPAILRIVLGVAFIAHGYPKLFKMFGGVAAWFDSIGLRPGKFWALVVGAVEFFCGIALIAGFFTQLAAALIAVNMFVAMAKVKWGSAKFVEFEKMGWELDLVYFAVAIALVFTGGGAWSLDRYFFFGY